MTSIVVPFVNLKLRGQRYSDRLHKALSDTLDAGDFIMGGPVQELESRLAKLCGTKHAISVNSGYDALALSLEAMGIGPGDEVITAVNSFVATAGAIARVGAIPVFCDIAEDYNIDPFQIERHITPRTKAIIPVHLTGQCARMDEINEIACRHGLLCLEDAAQAIGASYKGRPAGSWGIAAAFSLHPLKNFHVLGDGGFVTTNDDGLAERIKLLRNHGLVDRDTCVMYGANSRLDTLQARFALELLDELPVWTGRVREIAQMYRSGLEGVVELPISHDDSYHVYHNFVVRAKDRGRLQAFLFGHGIETKIHYPVLLHRNDAFKNRFKGGQCFSMAEKICSEQLSLPIYPEMDDESIAMLMDTLISFVGNIFNESIK